jgi:hypothetical protein
MKHNAIYRSNSFVHAVCLKLCHFMARNNNNNNNDFYLSVRVCFILATVPQLVLYMLTFNFFFNDY